uniref:Uncharacterized protein n=1 Tax=Anguilla anguilla TaxID=7936 RepID=A0A0E9TLG4_ANGAN
MGKSQTVSRITKENCI